MPKVARVLILMLMLVACSAPAVTPSTTPPATTTTTASPTTTGARIEVEVQTCATPPVTFSVLCEVYELLETWHVDTPPDAAALAAAAVEGLTVSDVPGSEDPPRTLFCAVPDPAFAIFCDALAPLAEDGVPVGPAVEAAVSHMIEVGLDPFTYYLPPELAGSIRINGIVGGIGALLDARDAVGSKCVQVSDVCRLEVVLALPGNPAAQVGLEEGDVIVTVDGSSVEGQRFTEVVAHIAGDETGTVVIEVERDGQVLEYSIERTPLVRPGVEYGMPFEDVGYLKIPDFDRDVPQSVYDSLAEIAQSSPDTLIVDLRDNPGGYVDAFLDIVDEFVGEEVVMISDSPGEHEEYRGEPGGLVTDPRLIVLVNQGTASAAEVLAGALRDVRGAVVVGTTTFGKDAVQIPFTLRNGGELYVAVARWTTPDGTSVGGEGLRPDVEIDWPVDGSYEEVVRLALEAAS